MDIHKKLDNAFLIIFALLMGLGAHYFQHNQGGSGLELPLNNVVWIFFSTLIGIGLWKITAAQKIFFSKFTLLFLVAFILFLIPIFYPNNFLAEQSYTRLLGLFAGFLLFVSLQQMRFNTLYIQRILLLIVLAGFLQGCYSLMQDYLLPADNIFGYNVGYGRPYGIFQQPNVLASFMATTLILSGYLLQKIECKKTQIFLLVTALLNMWVITIAMSRTGYLAVIIAVILLSPWAYQQHKKRYGLFMLTLLISIGFATLKGDALGARNSDSLKEGGQRLVHYSNSWSMIKEKPLMGYGYGSFEKQYLIHTAERVLNGESKVETRSLIHPHNDTLYWAVEGGVLPILAILLLVIGFLTRLKGLKLKQALALMALVIPITLHTQLEYPLYHSALHWLVLIVLVFYVANESEQPQQKDFSPTFALRSFALLIPIFTALFMLSNLYTISKITHYERSREPDIRSLVDIINPLVFQDRLDFYLSSFRLSIAMQTKNYQDIKEVIAWAKNKLEDTPEPSFYNLLYLAYKHNNQSIEAQKVLDHARYLYPKNEQLANAEKQSAAILADSQAQSTALGLN